MANRASSIVAGTYWPQVGGHRPVALLGDAEVAVEELPQVDDVLLGHRLVEAVLVVEGLHDGRVPQGRLTEVGGGGVARDEVGEDEGDQRDPDDQDRADTQASGQETAEPGGGDPPGSAAAVQCGCYNGQLAEVAQVDQPKAVRLQVLDPRGADNDLGRLDERDERPALVERRLVLLEDGLTGRDTGRRRRLVGQRGDGRGLGRRPSGPQADEVPGREGRGSRSGPGSRGPSTTAPAASVPAR